MFLFLFNKKWVAGYKKVWGVWVPRNKETHLLEAAAGAPGHSSQHRRGPKKIGAI